MPKPARTHAIHRAPNECCACHEPFTPKLLPFSCREDEGDGAGKIERFCPQCFAHVRAPQDARWAVACRLGKILAVKCNACGITSVSFGGHKCGQCGSLSAVLLLARGAHLVPGAKPVSFSEGVGNVRPLAYAAPRR